MHSVLTAAVKASSKLMDQSPSALFRANADGAPVLVASWGDPPTDVDSFVAKVPVSHRGHVWGWLEVASARSDVTSDHHEQLAAVADIIESAIDAAEVEAAAQRVGRTVAAGVGEPAVLAKIIEEAADLSDGEIRLLRFHANQSVTVFQRGHRPVDHRDTTSIDADGVPVVVAGKLWCSLVVSKARGSVDHEDQQRLNRFCNLIESPLVNLEQQARLQRLLVEQRSLRVVADLVVQGRPPLEIFTAVAFEAADLLDGFAVTLTRYDGDRYQVVEASPKGPAQRGQRIWIDPGTLPDRVRTTARPARVDDFSGEPNADLAIRFRLRAAVAVPVVVAGQVWGALTATSSEAPLPPGAEDGLMQFAGLIAGGLANVQARGEVEALTAEHAALRRVAELAAGDTSAEEILRAVAREAAHLAGVDFAAVLRLELDGSTEIVAVDRGPEELTVGLRVPMWADGAVQRSFRSRQPARADVFGPSPANGHPPGASLAFGSSAAAPIRIDAALWGVLVVVARDVSLPVGIEGRLSNFSELAGTAIATAQARHELESLARDQAALRRVAELVAHAVSLDEVFVAVLNEASALADHGSTLCRFLSPDVSVVVASNIGALPVGTRLSTEVDTVFDAIARTGRAVRLDTYDGTPMAATAREWGVSAAVTVPISVEGRTWGTVSSTSSGPPLAPGTENRLTHLADLAAAAIANAESKAKLTASRARIVAAADDTRRRLQRDVHDTAQQRLVHTIISLKMARDVLEKDHPAAPLVAEGLHNAEKANRDIRDVVRGILPAALTRSGLAGGLASLVDDQAIPVRLDVDVPRLPAAVEMTAYFVVAEALTNIIKHAAARQVDVRARLTSIGTLVLDIRDDGCGGADPARGTGLTGLVDRVEAGNGVITITSPVGAGTTVHVELPASFAGVT